MNFDSKNRIFYLIGISTSNIVISKSLGNKNHNISKSEPTFSITMVPDIMFYPNSIRVLFQISQKQWVEINDTENRYNLYTNPYDNMACVGNKNRSSDGYLDCLNYLEKFQVNESEPYATRFVR